MEIYVQKETPVVTDSVLQIGDCVDFINVWKFGEKKYSNCLCGEGNCIAWLSTFLTSHHIDLANQASNYLGALQKCNKSVIYRA